MKKRLTFTERNKIVAIAIKRIILRGEKPNYKSVSEETGLSETYIFKLIKAENQKPKGQRVPIIISLRRREKSNNRLKKIMAVIEELKLKGETINYRIIGEKIGLSESYVFRILKKNDIEISRKNTGEKNG